MFLVLWGREGLSSAPDGLQMQLLARRYLEKLFILQQKDRELLCFYSLAKRVSFYHQVIMRKHVVIYVAKWCKQCGLRIKHSSLFFLLCLFALFFNVSLPRGVEGIRPDFVDATLTSQSGSRQAHTQGEGCCLSWQALRRPSRSPDWLSIPSLWKSQPDWGKSRNRQWKLNNLSSFPSSLLVLLLLSRVCRGKII